MLHPRLRFSLASVLIFGLRQERVSQGQEQKGELAGGTLLQQPNCVQNHLYWCRGWRCYAFLKCKVASGLGPSCVEGRTRSDGFDLGIQDVRECIPVDRRSRKTLGAQELNENTDSQSVLINTIIHFSKLRSLNLGFWGFGVLGFWGFGVLWCGANIVTN